MAANFAKKNKSHEAILFDHNDNITEGNSSSIWIIKKDICYTHPISYRILKGCTRDKLIKILKTNNLQFKEKAFSLKSLLTADEVFMTSATNFVMPIIKIDKYKISKGKPGPISMDLRKKFIKAI
jgi:D-alanine transaminase